METAKKLLSWCVDAANLSTMTSFTFELLKRLNGCITSSCRRKVSHAKCLEKIWGTFHQERCSKSFKSLWEEFLVMSINCNDADPIFYQYITDYIFEMALKEKFPIKEKEACAETQETLSYEEENSLRFIAGYLLRAIEKKIKHSSLLMKKDILVCILDLLEDDDEPYDESSDWVKLRDRGGLNHVSNNMFMLLYNMELEVKAYIASNTKQPADRFNLKDVLSKKLQSNVDIEYYWELVSENWGEKESSTLLSLIIDHWITVRGFAYASTWMEMYKNATKKKVQKSKGIRKTLLGSTSDSVDECA